MFFEDMTNQYKNHPGTSVSNQIANETCVDLDASTASSRSTHYKLLSTK